MDPVAEDELDLDGDSKPIHNRTIVIHPGSQNLRIGLASDILPKNVPMVIARKCDKAEFETDDGEPRPKRRKVESDSDKLFEDEVIQDSAVIDEMKLTSNSFSTNMPQ